MGDSHVKDLRMETEAVMYGYILPIGDGKRILWYEAPRLVWGELIGLRGKTILLSPSEDVDLEKIPLLCHDNVYRIHTRPFMIKAGSIVGRLMLWGLIWLIGMDRPLEDLVGGLYLLLGLPMFVRLTLEKYGEHIRNVLDRFETESYSPSPKIVLSMRLAILESLIDDLGIIEAITYLDELGLGHLREFYRRVAWQKRWTIPPPTGAGEV
jgi:hypothetical protein